MGRGILNTLLSEFDDIGLRVEEKAEGKRREGYNRKYEYGEALRSGYGVFFLQYPSLLNFRHDLSWKSRRGNIKRILGAGKVPSNNQITNMLDRIEAAEFTDSFVETLKLTDKYGALKQFRILDGGCLAAADGVQFFSSYNINCDHCLHKEVEGKRLYYHSMVTFTIVKPGETVVLPLMPEMIRNEDKGAEAEKEMKQDCENKAFKRGIKTLEKHYSWLNLTILGDDLYSNRPVCEAVLACGMSYLFNCKPDSHKWLFKDALPYYELEEKEITDKKTGMIYRYKWVNNVDVFADKESFKSNYIAIEVYNTKKKGVTYTNSWITNKTITADNAALLASCGRTRWKTENELNNVLKNNGYNLEHNFGHGKHHACEAYVILNLLAFLMHAVLWMLDTDYKKARADFGRIDSFFGALRFVFRKVRISSWESFMKLIYDDWPGG